MSQHICTVSWERAATQPYVDHRYSRAHRWQFDGGANVAASSSPQVVPLPFSDPTGVDPEEAFVAALSSCHMLWFLDFCARAGHVVNSYRDEAVGVIGRDVRGRPAITRVTLHPQVAFAAEQGPSTKAHGALHHRAHEACFIANSVKTEVVCEPELL